MSPSFRSAYERNHWRFFNVLARLCGIGFIVGGGTIALRGIYLLTGVGSLSTGEASPGVAVAVGLPVIVVGVVLLRLSPFRPDLGDSPFSFSLSLHGSNAKRKWWTGDPE